jgi:tetratricopeptide (TPR) repeat protein
VGLVFQVLRRDWDAAMRYFWQSFGLAEAVEESGDLYGRSEIHRHLGFYYLLEDIRPHEAVRQLGHSLALRERLGDPRRIPSALVALGEAEMAAGNLHRAVELLRRAVTLAREAGLLPWRIQDAEQALRKAEAALSVAS